MKMKIPNTHNVMYDMSNFIAPKKNYNAPVVEISHYSLSAIDRIKHMNIIPLNYI